MHAVVAAHGAAADRLDAVRRAAASAGEPLAEWRAPDGRVRVAVVGSEAPVRAWARSEGRSVAVLGSGAAAPPGLADRLRDVDPAEGPTLLAALPPHAVAVAAGASGGVLTVAAAPGNHRVFVAGIEDGVLVSTHLGLLADALGADLRLDRSYEDFLLGFGFLPDGRTPYREVREHPAGTSRTWSAGSDGSDGSDGAGAATRPGRSAVSPAEPAAPSAEPPPPPAGREAARRALRDVLFRALEEQAGSRRRHAVLLGGFDSALVVAGLRQLGHDVDAYTFGFGDPRYEQRNAEAVAEHLGARHRWVRFTPEIVGRGLERFADVFNQPGPQPHYQIQTLHAARVAAEDGHRHLFTGDGCDAAFLGYPMVSQRARLVGLLGSLPGPLRFGLLRAAGAGSVERRLGHVARLVRSTLRAADLPPPASGHLPTCYLDPVALERLRTEPPPPQRESVRDVRIRLAEDLPQGLDPVRLAFDGKRRTGESRSKVEGAVAGSGVAQSSPYDHPLVRSFARSLPLEYLRPRGEAAGSPGKAILLETAEAYDLLPEAVIRMPKQSPVDSPVDRWYAGPLRPLVHRMLEGLPFEYDRGYLDEILAPKRVEELFREKISLGHHAFQAVGLLCSYAAFTGRAP